MSFLVAIYQLELDNIGTWKQLLIGLINILFFVEEMDSNQQFILQLN